MKASAQLEELIRPAVMALGYELWACEYLPQGEHSVLRVYIDIEKGITVDDCGLVSKQVNALLDVEDPIQGHYTLEVSSPGLNRPLFTVEHYKRYIGSKVKIKTRQAIDSLRTFRGELSRVDNDSVSVLVDKQEFVLPMADITKANLLEG